MRSFLRGHGLLLWWIWTLSPGGMGAAWAVPTEGSPRADRRAEVCLVARSAAAGLDEAALDTALRIEARRGEWDASIVLAPSASQCPALRPEMEGVVAVVGPAGALSWLTSRGQRFSAELDLLPPNERASEVARLVCGHWSRAELATAAALVPENDVLVPRDALTDARSPTDEAPWLQWKPTPVIWVGGDWAWQPNDGGTSTGRVGGEVHVGLLDERLAVGAAGAWMPTHRSEVSGGTLRRSGGEVLGMIRGGFRVSAWRIRMGIGVGVEWSRAEFAPDERFTSESRAVARSLLSFEPEVLWAPWEGLRVSLAVPLRVVPSRQRLDWIGQRVWADSHWSIGAALRVGWAIE